MYIRVMEMYKTTKENSNSNTVVKELNANVLIKTFTEKGIHMADVYKSKNGANEIVKRNSCAPVNSEYVKTIILIYE